MQPPSLSPQLEVATPERVAVSLPVAGLGSRAMAYLVDAISLFFFWVVVYFVLTLLVSDVLGLFKGLQSWVLTVLIVGVFATQWIYWTACEVFLDGQSLGKRVVGIRVVRADGSPVGFVESAIRNLCRAVDVLPAVYCAGVTCMLFDRQQRRLGDLAAGTLLVRIERVDLSKYLEQPAPSDSAARLESRDTELVLSFLERLPSLAPEARQRIGEGLVRRLGARLPPETVAQIVSTPETAEAWLRERVQGTGTGA